MADELEPYVKTDNVLHDMQYIIDRAQQHARRHYVPRAAASRLFDYPLRFAYVCKRHLSEIFCVFCG